jgi:uncharacterized protein
MALMRNRFVLPLIVLAIVLLVLWPAVAGFYTTFLWYSQLGYSQVFTTSLLTKLWLAAVVGLVSFVVLLANVRIARRLHSELPVAEGYFEIEGERIPAPNVARTVTRLAIPAAIVLAVLFSTSGWEFWETWLRFRHQTLFGRTDPVFGRDISFYVFTLPVLEAVAGWLLTLVGATIIATFLIYGTQAIEELTRRRFRLILSEGARRHLLILAGVFLLVIAFNDYLKIPGILFSDSGPVAGASYTDLHLGLPLFWIEVMSALVAASLAFVSCLRKKSTLLWLGVALNLAVFLVAGIVPAVFQKLSVAPNELDKESPYIERNIAATRHAFGLDNIEDRELSGDLQLTAQDIQENRRTINNIRLWDQKPVLDAFAQLQEIRTYYKFQSVDNDRYTINGVPQQIMLSARELSSTNLPTRNWINERLTFTHGYGLALGPVDQVTPEGAAELFVKDIPPVSTIPSLAITRPQIYFGELTNEQVYVRTKSKEFDYPSSKENVFVTYQGDGGIPIGTYWRRLLFATRLGESKLLLSDDLTAESRVLMHRNIRERLAMVTPFITYDSDPYMVISEGRLFWITDGYTTTDHYPYSEPTPAGFNYIRNSVKAVVDAYNGTVSVYIADDKDPLILTYARIFPGVLKPLSEMSADLRAHLRYPEEIFRIQTSVYSTYHMDIPQVFYNKEDQWSVASMSDASDQQEAQLVDPYYTIMKLPGAQTEEFLLMLPFTPRLKDNLASWIVARSDGEQYGKLAVYRFPKQKLIYGPKQVLARINQDPEISRQLSLWNQRGSQVQFGTLLVIPIKESLLYIQPLYLRAEKGKIPELRRVIVVAEDRMAMEPTLEGSINKLFGEGAVQPPGGPQQPSQPTSLAADVARPESRALIEQAWQSYSRAMDARREGDWTKFGEELKKVGQLLDQANREKK